MHFLLIIFSCIKKPAFLKILTDNIKGLGKKYTENMIVNIGGCGKRQLDLMLLNDTKLLTTYILKTYQ